MKVRCIQNDEKLLFKNGDIGGPTTLYSWLEVGKEYNVYGIVRNLDSFPNVKEGERTRYLISLDESYSTWYPQILFEVSNSYLGLEWYYNSDFTERAVEITGLEYILGYKELATDSNLIHYIETVKGANNSATFRKRKKEFDEFVEY